MSRSKRDQKGKRINHEIWGRSDFVVTADKVYPRAGGEPVGCPDNKRYAKKQVRRLRRRQAAHIIKSAQED